MSQPYAGYNGYPAAGAWPGYQHAGYGGYSYDYASYYQQQAPAQAYDPNYAAWYAQQQQQQQAAAGSQAGGVAPPPPPDSEPPPLPSEAPPPLPPGEPAQGGEAKAAASTPAATTPASTNSTSTAAAQQQQQQQYASYYQGQQHYDTSAYGGGYGYGAYAAQQGYGQQPPNYASGYSYSGQYGTPSALNSYASQVHQASSSTPNPALPSAAGAATAPQQATAMPAAQNDYSRMPPPASLAPPNSARAYGGAATSAAATGSNATPIGTASGTAAPSSLDAMRAAAAAVANRLTAGGQAQPQYVSVGSAAAAARPAGTSAVADASKDLPTSLQQYVARALALLGRTNETRLELRTVLRDVIAKHKKEGTLWSTDWDREPLPLLASQAHLASAVEPASRQQQQQRNAGVWDRLGGRDGSGQQEQDGGWPSSRKRNRHDRQHGGYDDSDSDGRSSDSADKYGSWGKKKRLDLQSSGGKKGGKAQQQQQQSGKKGKKGKRQQWGGEDDQWTAEEQAKHAARSARFAGGNGQQRSNTLAAYGWDEDSMAADDGEFIVGTCQTLEKGYFRLTRAPLPEEVRPQPVLARALSRLLGMIVAKQDKYLYYNDQFKAMRQDLTVQGIKNEFTVQVYEAHARAALEYGDGAEYNQCQTQLAILYASGLPGSHAEFGAYRLLYQSVHAAAGEGRKLLGTMRQLLGNKVGQVADSPEVEHAMQVRQALASANVSRFFRLYATAPRLGRCLMDVAVKQLRWKALNTLVRAHKPGLLPLRFLAISLGFLVQQDPAGSPNDQAAAAGAAEGSSSGAASAGRGVSVGPLSQQMSGLTVDERGRLLPGCSERSCVGENAAAGDQQEGLAACLDWCQRHGAVFDDEGDLSSCCLVTKDCWSKLFVPQDTTKVAHGDVNLDIRDFLAL